MKQNQKQNKELETKVIPKETRDNSKPRGEQNDMIQNVQKMTINKDISYESKRKATTTFAKWYAIPISFLILTKMIQP